MKRLLVLVALLLVFAAPAFASACWNGATGAMVWYTLDDAQHTGTTAMDICARTNLTEFNTPTTGLTGAFNQAYNFTRASSEYLKNDTSMFTRTGNNISVSFWVNLKTETDGDRLFSYGYDGASPAMYYLSMVYYSAGAEPDKWQVGVRYGAANYWWMQPAGDWVGVGNQTHVVIVWQGTNLTAYYNGTQQSLLAGTFSVGAMPDSANHNASTCLTVGAQATSAACAVANYANIQLLDEFAVWNYSLSASDVTKLFTTNSLGCTPSVTPTGAPVNENTTFYPGGCTAGTNWYWDFNNDGTIDSTAQNASWNYSATGINTVNLTITEGGANSTALTNITVTARPTANFTVSTATPFAGSSVQFLDASNFSTYTPGTWTWDFNDTNTSAVQNATNIFTLPGTYYVCLNVSNSVGVASAAPYCSNTTINGLAIDVFNEKTYAAISCWNVTFTNSTGSTYATTCRNNTFTWGNFSTIPTGALTVSITASGYVGRTYYRTYNLGAVLDLNAYLLDTSSGVYSYFLVQSATGTALEGAQITFTFNNGTDWLTAGDILTDSTGSGTMWLDWTHSYLVTTSLTGYTTVTKTITPQPTTYLIIMGSSSLFNYTHLNDTLWTFIDPTDPGVNITTDSITAGLLDPNSSISVCGLNLTYVNGTVFNSTNTTTEQYFCMNSLPLLGSGALATEKFYAVLWYTVDGVSSSWSRLYVPISTAYSLGDAQSGMFNYLGSADARLILAVLLTLVAGAAAAMYLGIGATIVMMGVSGLFFYWGWFAGFELLYIIVFVAGAALLYLETRT